MVEGDNTALLRMEEISKRFSGVRVLHSVDFELKQGEVHILAGENGAGKSTLIKILAGVHTGYEGRIILNGNQVRFKSPHDAAMQGISSIHQEMSLVNSMSVADNIFLGRERAAGNLWMDYRAQLGKTKELLSRLELDVNLSEPVENYSLSMRQMFEIAKALVYDTRILIMDEPTSALNQLEVKRLFRIVEDLKRKGCAVIYISHRLEEIYEIGDRITVLRDGSYVGTAAKEELSADELIQWMVGRKISRQFPERKAQPGGRRLRLSGFCVPDPSGSKKWAVEGATLELREGEILGIAGLQGSGKSELLNGLFGTYGKSTEGDVELEGRPFDVVSPRHSIGKGITLLTNNRKDTGIIPEMSIPRNITLASLKNFSSGGWLDQRREEEVAKGYVRDLNIKARSLEQEVETLSGGNQQKVMLSRWLETKPRVLLLDEPTRGVDVGAKQEIYALIDKWTAEGISILLLTSELPELLALSDRILVMHRGRITAEYSREEATQELVIEAAMGEERVQ